MNSEQPVAAPRHPVDQLDSLRRVTVERLKGLLKRQRGDKNYKRTLRAYLEADAHLQKALMRRVGSAHA